jgi:hypothetical protein
VLYLLKEVAVVKLVVVRKLEEMNLNSPPNPRLLLRLPLRLPLRPPQVFKPQ